MHVTPVRTYAAAETLQRHADCRSKTRCRHAYLREKNHIPLSRSGVKRLKHTIRLRSKSTFYRNARYICASWDALTRSFSTRPVENPSQACKLVHLSITREGTNLEWLTGLSTVLTKQNEKNAITVRSRDFQNALLSMHERY